VNKSPSSLPRHWRHMLVEHDIAAVVAWVHQFRLERTARTIAEITVDGRARSTLHEWQIHALLKVAWLRLQAPGRPVGAIAQEVAQATQQPRIRKIPIEKLQADLERLFRERDRVWRLLSRPTSRPSINEILEKLGLERVARICAALTQAHGERGQLEETESLSLLKIAHVKRSQPDRNLSDIVIGLALRPPKVGNRRIEDESFRSQLLRDSRRTRHIWTLLSNATSEPTLQAIARDSGRRRPIGERRALARIAQLLPTAVDFYDLLIAEIRVTEIKVADRDAKIASIKSAGRERVEKWLNDAVERRRNSPTFAAGVKDTIIPRRLFDLIKLDLQKDQLKRVNDHASLSPVNARIESNE
jgi:hypothetical protein